MPDSQNFDNSLLLIYVIINSVGIPQNFSRSGTLTNDLPNKGIATNFQRTTDQFIADPEGNLVASANL